MKTLSAAAFALCAGVPMLAQAPALQITSGGSSVQLYGVLDVGVAKVDHSLDLDGYHPLGANPTVAKYADKSATGMYDGGISQSRWGLKGSTDLGNDWKALFTLEGAINLRSGSVANAAQGVAQNKAKTPEQQNADSAVAGQLFSRGAFVGVSNKDFGTLTLGRHTALMLDIIGGYDALQGAQLFTPIGYSGTYGGGGATDNSRLDNSVKYKGKWSDFSVAFLHKFGGVAGVSSARSSDQISFGWEPGAFGIQVAYQTYKDAFSVGSPDPTAVPAQPVGTVVLTAYDTKATMLTARYKAGPVFIKGGYQQLKYTNPSNPTEDANTTSLFGQVVSLVKVTPYTVGGVEMEKKLDVYWLGAAWDVTDKFNAGVSYYHVKQNDFSRGLTVNGANNAGNAKYTSLLLDYRFTKSFDAYMGYMAVSTDGGLGNTTIAGYLYDSNATLGLGIRYAF
ncbi:MAG TPA: porin [Holophagaceae bacterium]|nr:porin [Holophagaceae bacterium]